MLAETDEIPYECQPRHKYPMLFEEPIPLQVNIILDFNYNIIGHLRLEDAPLRFIYQYIVIFKLEKVRDQVWEMRNFFFSGQSLVRGVGSNQWSLQRLRLQRPEFRQHRGSVSRVPLQELFLGLIIRVVTDHSNVLFCPYPFFRGCITIPFWLLRPSVTYRKASTFFKGIN